MQKTEAIPVSKSVSKVQRCSNERLIQPNNRLGRTHIATAPTGSK